MAIKRSLLIFVVAGLAAAQQQTTSEQEPLAWRILKWSEADQVSWINTTLAMGIPPELGGALGSLAANKGSLTLPLIEQKIEEVLRSQSPLDLFIDKTIDTQKFIALAVSAITYEGDELALREVSKLLHLDAKRFDDAVEVTMIESRTNPFLLAYQGFAIGDPALDTRIAAWAEWELAANNKPPLPPALLAKRRGKVVLIDPPPEPDGGGATRQSWAEAMVAKYGGVPSEAQWQSDPIASRLSAPMARSLHDDMIGRASDIVQNRVKR